MAVPFLDLHAQYQSIKPQADAAIQAVLDRCAYAGGPFVEQFEEDFASFIGVDHAVAVGSGTEALWLMFAALGIGSGDEVITVSHTFIATAEAISMAGATPVFVDVNEFDATMNPAEVESAITPQTRAIVPVHLYGQCADMAPILEIGRRHGIPVLEDAAQAHGATYRGQMAGSIGQAAAFSFYPGKNLGAYGEGGAVTTNDAALAERVRMLRDHGQSRKYHHELIGANGRMDGIQGAILSVKLGYLNEWNAHRRANAAEYRRLLAGHDAITPIGERGDGRHAYHLMVVRVRDRDGVLQRLQDAGIGCGIHYPIPVHRQTAYAALGLGEDSFPVSEAIAASIVSLPMYAELTPSQIFEVVDALASAVEAPAAVASA